jgi:hypothetical protein
MVAGRSAEMIGVTMAFDIVITTDRISWDPVARELIEHVRGSANWSQQCICRRRNFARRPIVRTSLGASPERWMSELKRLLVCSLRSSHLYSRHTSRAAENGAFLTVYANRFARKGARSVCMMLTLSIAPRPGLQRPVGYDGKPQGHTRANCGTLPLVSRTMAESNPCTPV